MAPFGIERANVVVTPSRRQHAMFIIGSEVLGDHVGGVLGKRHSEACGACKIRDELAATLCASSGVGFR